ncbi:hypothetical protein KY285_015968 [Solanum tuberosum]|nr:hypothetical protein KY285_015968 [Solanum tuberosum]
MQSLYFVQDDDFISFILNGLDSSFGIFKAALNMRSGTITPEELFGLLLQEEERLAEELHSTTISTQFSVAPSHALQTSSRSIPKQAHLASPSAIVDPAAWYFDSGATHHVTSDMANLSLQTYTGNDGLAVGNGNCFEEHLMMTFTVFNLHHLILDLPHLQYFLVNTLLLLVGTVDWLIQMKLYFGSLCLTLGYLFLVLNFLLFANLVN